MLGGWQGAIPDLCKRSCCIYPILQTLVFPLFIGNCLRVAPARFLAGVFLSEANAVRLVAAEQIRCYSTSGQASSKHCRTERCIKNRSSKIWRHRLAPYQTAWSLKKSS